MKLQMKVVGQNDNIFAIPVYTLNCCHANVAYMNSPFWFFLVDDVTLTATVKWSLLVCDVDLLFS